MHGCMYACVLLLFDEFLYICTGVANIASCFVSSYPVTGSFSR